MPVQDLLDERMGGGIKRHKGFIEHPQGVLLQQQAGQCDAPLLALREHTHGQGGAASQAQLF